MSSRASFCWRPFMEKARLELGGHGVNRTYGEPFASALSRSMRAKSCSYSLYVSRNISHTGAPIFAMWSTASSVNAFPKKQAVEIPVSNAPALFPCVQGAQKDVHGAREDVERVYDVVAVVEGAHGGALGGPGLRAHEVHVRQKLRRAFAEVGVAAGRAVREAVYLPVRTPQ